MAIQIYWLPQISLYHHMINSEEGYASLACNLGEVCSSDIQQRPLKSKYSNKKLSYFNYLKEIVLNLRTVSGFCNQNFSS